MRIIDADALIAEMHNTTLEDGEDRSIFYGVIERQPTIDAVEVVRCDNCKYRYMDADLQVYACTYGLMIKPNGFCNYGERKTEPQTEREGE